MGEVSGSILSVEVLRWVEHSATAAMAASAAAVTTAHGPSVEASLRLGGARIYVCISTIVRTWKNRTGQNITDQVERGEKIRALEHTHTSEGLLLMSARSKLEVLYPWPMPLLDPSHETCATSHLLIKSP